MLISIYLHCIKANLLPNRKNEEALDKEAEPKEGTQPLHFDAKFAQNVGGQYRLLTQRYMATYWRTTEYNAVRQGICTDSRHIWHAAWAFLLPGT